MTAGEDSDSHQGQISAAVAAAFSATVDYGEREMITSGLFREDMSGPGSVTVLAAAAVSDAGVVPAADECRSRRSLSLQPYPVAEPVPVFDPDRALRDRRLGETGSGVFSECCEYSKQCDPGRNAHSIKQVVRQGGKRGPYPLGGTPAGDPRTHGREDEEVGRRRRRNAIRERPSR